MKIKNSSGSLLLLTVIGIWVASFVCITFLTVSLAQYRMADAEKKRVQAYQELRGCLDFAHGALCNGATPPAVEAAITAEHPEVTFTITPGASGYNIRGSITYIE